MKNQDDARRKQADSATAGASEPPELREFIRPENEDDDGYDPYSDRPATREPLFEEDPWA